MFNLNGNFLCNNSGVERHTRPFYTKNGWVPTITTCCQNITDEAILKMESQVVGQTGQIPRVTGVHLDGSAGQLLVTWNANGRYLTEIQIKEGDGEWETLPLYDIGTGHA